MRTTLKIVLPLIISVVVVSLLFAVYQVRTDKRMLRNEVSRRAEILAESLQENIEPLFDRALPDKSLQRIVDRFGQREHLKGIAVYNASGNALALTPGLSPTFQSRPATATHAALRDAGLGEFVRVNDVATHIYAVPLHRNGQTVGTLVLVHDTSYIDTQVSHTLRDSLVNALVQTLFITGLALILVRWTLTGPLTRTAKWLRGLATGVQRFAVDRGTPPRQLERQAAEQAAFRGLQSRAVHAPIRQREQWSDSGDRSGQRFGHGAGAGAAGL